MEIKRGVDMDRQVLLHNLIKNELIRCTHLYNRMVYRFDKLIKGSLVIRNEEPYYYRRINNKQYLTLIRDPSILAELKERRFIKKALPVLEKRIKLCNQFLENDIYYDPDYIDQLLPDKYQGANYVHLQLDGNVDLEKWLASGNKNPAPFHEPHYTANGVKCRSKSEAMIGTYLENRGLIYITEPEIRLKHRTVYPDFAILLPKSKRIIYFEHFGQIDSVKYAVNNFPKPGEYAQVGIYLGLNFFYTYETKDRPLNFKIIEAKINEILELDI